MSNIRKNKIIFNAPLHNPNIVENVEGDFNVNQENQNKALYETLAETKIILSELRQKHPQVSNKEQAIEIIEAEFEDNKSTQSWQWKNLISLKRLWNGSRLAATKITERLTEENLWGIGIIAFLEGITEDIEK